MSEPLKIQTPEPTKSAFPLFTQHYDFHARAESVTDGDTVRFLVDNRMYMRSSHPLRLEFVFAAEKNTVEGLDTRDYVLRWVDHHMNHTTRLSWPFYLITQADKQTFNRYIGTCWCRICGAEMNDDITEWIARYRTQ